MKGYPLHGCRAERGDDVRATREVTGHGQDLFQLRALVDVVHDDDRWVWPPTKSTNQISQDCKLSMDNSHPYLSGYIFPHINQHFL